MFVVVLKSLKTGEVITLSEGYTSRETADNHRKEWRRVLGGKNWTINRRPGLDTLDALALTTEQR